MFAACTVSASGPDSSIFVPAGTFHAEVEGPDTDSAGNLYAVNFGGPGDEHKGSIGKVAQDGKASLHLRLPAGSTGNGIQMDAQGVMWIADYTGHQIWRYANGTLSSFVHEPKAGVIFASDPDWKNSKGQLWRISADGKAALIDQTGTSNGVEVSPDQHWLYVNESAQRKVWAYPLNDQLETGAKRLLIEFADFGLDGMRCDSNGNLYIARYGKGTVVKLSPAGAVLKEFKLHGQFPTNVALSPDERFLYVTMQRDGSIERIDLQ
jgi:sugar lactone lactonase YvrE